MKKIILTQGKFAKVDDSDYEKLNKFKWFAHFNHKWYVIRNINKSNSKQTQVKMHRVLMNAPLGVEIDHINGDGLDNRRKNLRLCSRSQNAKNRKKNINSTSGVKGVHFSKSHNKWIARIQVDGKRLSLGDFLSKESAYKAYCEACIKYHGKFSNIK